MDELLQKIKEEFDQKNPYAPPCIYTAAKTIITGRLMVVKRIVKDERLTIQPRVYNDLVFVGDNNQIVELDMLDIDFSCSKCNRKVYIGDMNFKGDNLVCPDCCEDEEEITQKELEELEENEKMLDAKKEEWKKTQPPI